MRPKIRELRRDPAPNLPTRRIRLRERNPIWASFRVPIFWDLRCASFPSPWRCRDVSSQRASPSSPPFHPMIRPTARDRRDRRVACRSSFSCSFEDLPNRKGCGLRREIKFLRRFRILTNVMDWLPHPLPLRTGTPRQSQVCKKSWQNLDVKEFRGQNLDN